MSSFDTNLILARKTPCSPEYTIKSYRKNPNKRLFYFEVFIWALIQGGRLLSAGRIMILLALAMKLVKKKVIMILYFFLKTN